MRNSNTKLVRLFLCATLAVGLAGGCGGGNLNHPELAEASGVVTVNGKPVENVTIMFTPEAGGHASRGTTDAAGKFRVMYDNNTAGAMLGQHEVKFMHVDADAPADLLPRKYADQTASMKAEVTKAGPNEFTFDLKGK